jgi:hypothetical protein
MSTCTGGAARLGCLGCLEIHLCKTAWFVLRQAQGESHVL